MKSSRKRLRWSVTGIALIILIFLGVQKIENAKRAEREAAKRPSFPTSDIDDPGSGARTSAARSGHSATSAAFLENSPDGRFQAEGGFVNTPNREGFRLKPFPVTQKSAEFAWTSIDGKTAAAVRELSHNDLEEGRLTGDNAWVEKRQLVYCDDYIGDLGQSVANDAPHLKSIKLPGFDGVEYDVDVDRTDSPQGAMEWNIAGHLKGRPDTMVSLSTVHGYTAIVIFAPDFYIEGDAREPGEVVLNQIDRQAKRDGKPKSALADLNPFNVGEPAPPAR
jgi:hypothetical protein